MTQKHAAGLPLQNHHKNCDAGASGPYGAYSRCSGGVPAMFLWVGGAEHSVMLACMRNRTERNRTIARLPPGAIGGEFSL